MNNKQLIIVLLTLCAGSLVAMDNKDRKTPEAQTPAHTRAKSTVSTATAVQPEPTSTTRITTMREKGGALFTAIHNGQTETARLLLATHPALMAIIDNHGNMPLHAATMQNNPALIDLILSTKFSRQAIQPDGSIVPFALSGVDFMEIENAQGLSPISLAGTHGYVEALKLFIKYGYDVNRRRNPQNLQQDAFNFALSRGHQDVAQLYLDNGYILQLPNEKMLFQAALYGQEEIVKSLIKAGASVNMQLPNGNTPLINICQTTSYREQSHHAIFKQAGENIDKMVALLLQQGAHPNLRDNLQSRNALSYACENGYDKAVRILLPVTRVNFLDRVGYSVLRMARDIKTKTPYDIPPSTRALLKEWVAKFDQPLLDAIGQADFQRFSYMLEKIQNLYSYDAQGNNLLHTIFRAIPDHDSNTEIARTSTMPSFDSVATQQRITRVDDSAKQTQLLQIAGLILSFAPDLLHKPNRQSITPLMQIIIHKPGLAKKMVAAAYGNNLHIAPVATNKYTSQISALKKIGQELRAELLTKIQNNLDKKIKPVDQATIRSIERPALQPKLDIVSTNETVQALIAQYLGYSFFGEQAQSQWVELYQAIDQALDAGLQNRIINFINSCETAAAEMLSKNETVLHRYRDREKKGVAWMHQPSFRKTCESLHFEYKPMVWKRDRLICKKTEPTHCGLELSALVPSDNPLYYHEMYCSHISSVHQPYQNILVDPQVSLSQKIRYGFRQNFFGRIDRITTNKRFIQRLLTQHLSNQDATPTPAALCCALLACVEHLQSWFKGAKFIDNEQEISEDPVSPKK